MGSHYFPDGNRLADADPALDPKQNRRRHPPRPRFPTHRLRRGRHRRPRHERRTPRRPPRRSRPPPPRRPSTSARPASSREQIFTHCGGWKEGELLYRPPSTPTLPRLELLPPRPRPARRRDGHGRPGDERRPVHAVEWLPVGAKDAADYKPAAATLDADRCRYSASYNWRSIANNPEAPPVPAATLAAKFVRIDISNFNSSCFPSCLRG